MGGWPTPLRVRRKSEAVDSPLNVLRQAPQTVLYIIERDRREAPTRLFRPPYTASVLDLGAYLERIGLSGQPSPAAASPSSTTVTPVAREAVPELLATRFELGGFGLDGDGRVIRETAAAPPGAP